MNKFSEKCKGGAGNNTASSLLMVTNKLVIATIACLFFVMSLAPDINGQTICDIPCDTDNIVINGDFEGGDVGFSSSLQSICKCGVGTYSIGSEPRDKCPNSLWIDDLFDHTLGTAKGHFMIIDGPDSAETIWKQAVSVVAGDTYLFSFWAVPEISTNNTDFPAFDMVVDGVVITSVSTAGSPDNEWSQYCAEWIATTTGIVSIGIIQTGGFGGFNDYRFR